MNRHERGYFGVLEGGSKDMEGKFGDNSKDIQFTRFRAIILVGMEKFYEAQYYKL